MKTVTIYALSTCIHCKHCKEYLDERGQPYECIYVDRLTGDERKQTIETIKKVNPNLSFPTVMVGDDVVVGFDKTELEKFLGT